MAYIENVYNTYTEYTEYNKDTTEQSISDDPYGILKFTPDSNSLEELLSVISQSNSISEKSTLSTFARPGDVCTECNCALQVTEMEYECPSCHILYEAANIQDVIPTNNSEGMGATNIRGRLRIVGPEAGWYQPDMDRSNPGESSDHQKNSTYEELLRFNDEYKSRGGNPFPLDVLHDVAVNYCIVQQHSIKRSMIRKAILAALLIYVCISRGFTRTRAEAAEFVKLPTHGIARGDDFLRSINEDKGLDININENSVHPHIITVFAQLDLSDKQFEPLRDAVAKIVEIAINNYIGYKSIMRSKVTAATAEVLQRKKINITAGEISIKCNIRMHTIRRFLNKLVDYHSYFEKVYIKYELISTRHAYI